MVYIIDYLGAHCGMHYYNAAFQQILTTIPNVDIKVLSNYTHTNFFLNQYKGNTINKIKSLIINYYRLYKFVNHNKNDIYILLSYGNLIDLLFLEIVSHYHHIIDIHEVVAQSLDENKILKFFFSCIYSKKIKTVIVHSERTDFLLNKLKYN